ncbi:MAG: metallophosphoesterase [Spirochaetota bacterium]
MGDSVHDLREATKTLLKHRYRLKNSYKRPGGLIDLASQDPELVMVGDLHGAHENLKQILKHESVEERVARGEVILVILGDGPHNDQTGQMKEMESSILVMDEVVRLLLAYGDSVIYIRGNHDTFEPRLAKSGIQQGLELRNYCLATRGPQYTEALEAFFEALPFVVLGKDFIITHAGPIRNGCLKQELIDIEDNEDLRRQLMWNRIHELRGGTPSMKEYDADDIARMKQKLGLPEDAYFIVGHNPMWRTGNMTGIWRNVLGIKNHFILYANLATKGPYLVLKNGVAQEKFSVQKTEDTWERIATYGR